MKGKEGTIKKPVLEFDNSFPIQLPNTIKAGYSITCDGSQKLRIYDHKGRFIETFDMSKKMPILRKGRHSLRFNCTFSDNDDLIVKFIIKQKGKEEKISL